MYHDPTVPGLDEATIEAEDRLFEAVEPVLDAWMLARDNICEELERRSGMTMFSDRRYRQGLGSVASARGRREVRPGRVGPAAAPARLMR
jgi:hypothetical protein